MKRATRSFAFPGHLRLRNRGRFERVLATGKRGGDRQLQIWVLPNDLAYSRLGLIVGRRHGGAVQRNRIKRVLREAFRLSREELPRGVDIACAPRVGARIELESAMRSLVEIVRRLARDLEQE